VADVRELRVALTVADFDDALAFYRDALGLEQAADWSSEEGRVVLFDAGRATLELFDEAQAAMVDGIEAGRRVSGPVRLALEVADSEETAQRLVTAGGVLVSPPVTTPWGDHNVRVRAPDGMQLTLFTPDRASVESTGAQTEANKQLVRRFVEEVVNQRNVDPLDELAQGELAELGRRWISPFRSAFPDFTMEIVELVAENDTVVGHFKCSGTHRAEWLGVAGTGRRFRDVREVYIFKVRNGRLASAIGVEDNLARIRQLGIQGELAAEP
jgi:lactoylglutathione lyase